MAVLSVPPDYPGRFQDVAHARRWFTDFFDWYAHLLRPDLAKGWRLSADGLARRGRVLHWPPLAGGGFRLPTFAELHSAGTTTRAIYSLFEGKKGLLAAMCRQMARDFSERHAGVARHDDECEELIELALAYRESALTHPRLYPLVVFGRPGFTPADADMELARAGYVRVHKGGGRRAKRGYDRATALGAAARAHDERARGCPGRA